MKHCTDCKHHFEGIFGGDFCQHNRVVSPPDIIDGTIAKPRCDMIRNDRSLCGVEATMWEPNVWYRLKMKFHCEKAK